MKIVSWNCAGALRNKVEHIDTLMADILVIQECENPATSTENFKSWSGNYLWIGESRNKGLGIFARNGNTINKLSWNGSYTINEFKNQNPSLSWNSEELHSFLPCIINEEVTLLGIWTKQAHAPNFRYIGQLWKYIQIHRPKLQSGKTILCGDLNSNTIWDELDRWWNHSDVVREFEDINIYSLYHKKSKERQGEETEKTFFMYRDLKRGYHIDYFFVSEDIIGKCV
jgi:exonuclease III